MTIEDDLKVSDGHLIDVTPVRMPQMARKQSRKKFKVKNIHLTAAQEAFCQDVASGLGLTESYTKYYRVKTDPDHKKYVYIRAYNLSKREHVANRIKELKNGLEAVSLWKREDSVRALIEAYTIAKEQRNSGAMTVAVKELNVMHGYNEAIKVDVGGQAGNPIVIALEERGL